MRLLLGPTVLVRQQERVVVKKKSKKKKRKQLRSRAQETANRRTSDPPFTHSLTPFHPPHPRPVAVLNGELSKKVKVKKRKRKRTAVETQ